MDQYSDVDDDNDNDNNSGDEDHVDSNSPYHRYMITSRDSSVNYDSHSFGLLASPHAIEHFSYSHPTGIYSHPTDMEPTNNPTDVEPINHPTDMEHTTLYNPPTGMETNTIYSSAADMETTGIYRPPGTETTNIYSPTDMETNTIYSGPTRIYNNPTGIYSNAADVESTGIYRPPSAMETTTVYSHPNGMETTTFYSNHTDMETISTSINATSPQKHEVATSNYGPHVYAGESSPIPLSHSHIVSTAGLLSPYHENLQKISYPSDYHQQQQQHSNDINNVNDDDASNDTVDNKEADISLEMIYTRNDLYSSDDITTTHVNTSLDFGLQKETNQYVHGDGHDQPGSHAKEVGNYEQLNERSDVFSISSLHSDKSIDRSISKVAVAALPYPWVEYLSHEGWPYYYNEKTGESRWERPIEMRENFGAKIASVSVNAQGQSPVHISARETAFEGLSILLQSGVAPNLLNAQGQSALQILSSLPWSERQILCMKVLLDFGADVNCSDANGNSLLHHCVMVGNHEAIKLLLQYEVDCSYTNVEHDTALHLAAKLNQVQCMQTLVLGDSSVAKTTKPAALSNNQKNAFPQNGDDDNLFFQDVDETLSVRSQSLDPRYGSIDEKRRLKEAGWVKYTTPQGEVYYHNEVDDRVQWEYPLLPLQQQAVDTTNIIGSEIDSLKIQKSSSMSTHNVDARRVAPKVSTGSMKTSVINNYASKPNPQSSQSSSAGSRNIESYIQQVEQSSIIDFGSASHAKNTYATAKPELKPEAKRPERVSKAIKRRDSFESLSDLSEEGSVSAKQKHLQVWNRFFENAISAKEGNSVGAANPFNRNEASIGGFSPNKSTIKANKSKWPEVPSDKLFHDTLITVRKNHASSDRSAASEIAKNNALIFAVLRGDVAATEELLLIGGNPTCVDEQIRSPAHFACKNGHVEVLALLYDHGADFEAFDMFGRSPLHIACAYGHEDVIRFLLESAVEVDLLDNAGNSPLHISARAGYAACCQLLLSYGANISIKNKLGLDVLTTVQSIQPRNSYIQEVEHVLMQHGFIATGSITSDSDRQRDKKRSGHQSQRQQKLPNGENGNVKGDWEQVAKNLTKRGSEQLEKKKEGDTRDPSPPWANLSIDTSVLKSTNVISTAANNNNAVESVTNKPLPLMHTSNIDDEVNDNTDNSDDDDDDDDDDYNSVGNSVSEALWGVATSLIGVTINMFSKSKKGEASWLTRKGAIPMPKHKDDDGSHLTKWTLSQAPPTDSELHQIGLGFHSAPPSSLKDQINAQVESIKTGRTPRRINPQAPTEVKMALAYAKVEVERLRTSPKNEEDNVKPSVQYGGPMPGPPTFPLSSVHMAGSKHDDVDTRDNNNHQNVYSIGGSLPRGVAWRYVDVFGEEGRVST